MAAGIVASTLRRKAFHRRAGPDTRYQAIEPGHIAASPTEDTSPGGTPRDSNISPRLPRGALLSHRDFWPSCQNPSEAIVHQLVFDTCELVLITQLYCYITHTTINSTNVSTRAEY